MRGFARHTDERESLRQVQDRMIVEGWPDPPAFERDRSARVLQAAPP